jgi:hypothetical protein
VNIEVKLWILVAYYELAHNFETLVHRALLLNVLIVIKREIVSYLLKCVQAAC